MKRISYFRLAQLAMLALILSPYAGAVWAQTTSFTYQGSLNDGGSPANGQYDLEFKLFNALSGGAQQGSTIIRDDVQATGGVFSVTLDFGAAAFPGALRFLEIGVRPGAGTGVFTTLSPRQQITSTPYAIRSLNATSADALSSLCANCVTSGQIGGVSGSAITGAIPVASVPAGSGAYVQNTTSQQSSANFNISGNGTVGGTLTGDILNATTQYNLGGSRVLSTAGSGNLFVGPGTGQSNTTGGSNAFFGLGAGFFNTTGGSNAFFGRNAGGGNTTGGNNAFFGWNAGSTNTTGSNNTVIGAGGLASGGLSFATAIGAGAVVSTSNTVVLGRNPDTVSVPGNLTVAGMLAAALPGGSANYIQNVTAQQASANFNISGNGTAGGTLSAGAGVFGSLSGAGVGVSGKSAGGAGVSGESTNGTAMFGFSNSGTGVFGQAFGPNGIGVKGESPSAMPVTSVGK